ncbi:MAG: type II secretion system protein GspG [Acidimicrobiales bacterium]
MKLDIKQIALSMALVALLVFLIRNVVVVSLHTPPSPELKALHTRAVVSQWFVMFKIALQTYKLDVGNYPSSEDGLNALLHPPNGKEGRWRGPYLEEIPNDPWDRPYQYRYPGEKNINGARRYDVWSWGPDGVHSGDDIGNW